MNLGWTQVPGPRMTRLEGNCQQETTEFPLPFDDFLQFLFHSVSSPPSDAEAHSGSSSLHNSESVSESNDDEEQYYRYLYNQSEDDEQEQEIFQSTSFKIGQGLIPKVSIRFATRTPSMSSHTEPSVPLHLRPSPQSDTLSFYKNFSASYGRRRRSRTMLNTTLNDAPPPFSSAKGLSRSVPMKLNSFSKRNVFQSSEHSPLPPVKYNTPQGSALSPKVSPRSPVHDPGEHDANNLESENDTIEDIIEEISNKTMSLFLSTATSPIPKKLARKHDMATQAGQDSMQRKQVIQRRKTMC